MIEIVLSSDEILQAVLVATMRKITSDKRRGNGNGSRRPEHYEETRSWDQEIESCMAEIAVSRWRNRYWSGGHFNGRDAGRDAGNAQVRWTSHDGGHLIVYPEDGDDDAFVFVTGRSPSMRIVGWMYGREAKTDPYWRTDVRCPSWWVPQNNLKQVEKT
jgi:hypothetical protein